MSLNIKVNANTVFIENIPFKRNRKGFEALFHLGFMEIRKQNHMQTNYRIHILGEHVHLVDLGRYFNEHAMHPRGEIAQWRDTLWRKYRNGSRSQTVVKNFEAWEKARQYGKAMHQQLALDLSSIEVRIAAGIHTIAGTHRITGHDAQVLVVDDPFDLTVATGTSLNRIAAMYGFVRHAGEPCSVFRKRATLMIKELSTKNDPQSYEARKARAIQKTTEYCINYGMNAELIARNVERTAEKFEEQEQAFEVQKERRRQNLKHQMAMVESNIEAANKRIKAKHDDVETARNRQQALRQEISAADRLVHVMNSEKQSIIDSRKGFSKELERLANELNAI